MIHLGVDLHRTFCYVTALDANGTVLHQGRVNNQREALQAYLRRWPQPVRVVFEACSFWPAFVDAVESEVAQLYMVHPQRVKAIASAKLKNDRVTAVRTSPGAHFSAGYAIGMKFESRKSLP